MTRLTHAVLAATLALFVAFPEAQTRAAKSLVIYVVDVEGGNAQLWVTPSGESVLVDTGNGGAAAVRDADRIMAAVKDAGLSQIDHLIDALPRRSRRRPSRARDAHSHQGSSSTTGPTCSRPHKSIRAPAVWRTCRQGEAHHCEDRHQDSRHRSGLAHRQRHRTDSEDAAAWRGCANPYCAGFKRRRESCVGGRSATPKTNSPSRATSPSEDFGFCIWLISTGIRKSS